VNRTIPVPAWWGTTKSRSAGWSFAAASAEAVASVLHDTMREAAEAFLRTTPVEVEVKVADAWLK
jgi:hypothetical protein